jgi:hypothetical protein
MYNTGARYVTPLQSDGKDHPGVSFLHALHILIR